MIEAVTTTEWSGVLADLRSKRQLAMDNLASLRGTKRELALDAAMGNTDAQRRLDRINAELNRFSLEVDSLDMALDKALTMETRAIGIEAEAAEQARQAELTKLSEVALTHAAAYTDAIRKAVSAATALKMTIHNMIVSWAVPGEKAGLNELLYPGVYMRGAEACGLRGVLEIAPYTGAAVHIVPLEQEIANDLARWLPPAPAPAIETQELHELQEDGTVAILKGHANPKPNGKEYKKNGK